MMEQWLVFFVFCGVLFWEYYRPKSDSVVIETRWFSNFSLTALAAALIYIVEKLFFESRQETLVLPTDFSVEEVGIFLLWFAILDLFFYFCHRVSHIVPFLWKLHRVHHSDPHLDISTNFRHHPVEYLWVFILLSGFVSLFDINGFVLSVYLLSATVIQIWHHGNIRLPAILESFLGLVVVTPAIHEVHHQAMWRESNSNFGSVFSFWDRLFKTFIPHLDHASHINFGINGLKTNEHQKLLNLINQPFYK